MQEIMRLEQNDYSDIESNAARVQTFTFLVSDESEGNDMTEKPIDDLNDSLLDGDLKIGERRSRRLSVPNLNAIAIQEKKTPRSSRRSKNDEEE
eukprot:Pgem_evm1s19861